MTALHSPPQNSILLIRPKFPRNVGAAIRAASCFGATNVYYTEDRFGLDTLTRLPREERMKGYSEVTWGQVDAVRPIDEIKGYLKHGPTPIAIELLPGSEPLNTFEHPDQAIYVFGPEDGSLSAGIRSACHRFVQIPSQHCLNLAAAVYLVQYDRMAKRVAAGLQSAPNVDEEGRGYWHSPSLEEIG